MSARKTKTVTEEVVMEDPNNHPAVLARQLEKLERSMQEGLKELRADLHDYASGFVSFEKLADAQKGSDEKHKEQDRRLDKLENWNTWAVRIVLAAVITAGVALVTTFGSKL